MWYHMLSLQSALCVYSKFGHHPHPLGNLCAKFCFFCGIHCWASQCRKITYSITQYIWCPGTEACASENCCDLPNVQHTANTIYFHCNKRLFYIGLTNNSIAASLANFCKLYSFLTVPKTYHVWATLQSQSKSFTKKPCRDAVNK